MSVTAASGHPYRGEEDPAAEMRQPWHVRVGDPRAAGTAESLRRRCSTIRFVHQPNTQVRDG